MDRELIAKLVQSHEGSKNAVYIDTRGNLTVGIGFNLDAPGAILRCESLGIDYEKLCTGEIVLTDEEVTDLFDLSLNDAIQYGLQGINNFEAQPDQIQAVLVDMIFNLGWSKFLEFKKFIAAIEAKDYSTAVIEIKDSLWYLQTKERAIEDAGIISNFCTPNKETVNTENVNGDVS